MKCRKMIIFYAVSLHWKSHMNEIKRRSKPQRKRERYNDWNQQRQLQPQLKSPSVRRDSGGKTVSAMNHTKFARKLKF